MYDIKQVLEDKLFVRQIEYLKEEIKRSIFKRESKIILNDFSVLFIKEIWKEEQLHKYSYYWFTANNKLIIGWDNAPHHSNIESYPHHKHREDAIESSNETDFPQVIEYINRIFYP